MKFPLSLFFLPLLFSACTAQQQKGSEHPYTNALINESSPYLLQHAHNPVNWQPWNDEAFEAAETQDKLVLISVGYAACHWCHVMEHESFEDTAVANLMNARFISIKVDREERPDVDDVYMSACQLMNSRGCGWPLNVITLPDGRPVFAGTYYPREQWVELVKQVSDFYRENPEKMEEIAQQVTEGMQNIESIPLRTVPEAFAREDLTAAWEQLSPSLDFQQGGRKGAPKFPMPVNYRFLLEYGVMAGEEKALEAVRVTLDEMAAGGIYDHLGGGFARYSTDAEWIVPHFEKMLYDNGQLVSLYSQAYRLEKEERYKEVLSQSLEFVARELTSPEGAFYSSLDADSEGEEGKYYVWEKRELDSLLGKDSELFCQAYEVSAEGNWEAGKNILYRRKSLAELAQKAGMRIPELQQKLESARTLLMKARQNRIRPGLDDKVITAWNALMLTGYVDAYRALGEQRYLDAALKNAHFIRENCWHEGNRLTRIHKGGKASINAFLDDYAHTIRAFTALYQVTFDEQWLMAARDLVAYVQLHFYDENSGMFFYTSDLDDPLITRKMETADNVIPGSNSTMARALFELGTLLYQEEYLQMATQMLSNVKMEVLKDPGYYANWLALLIGQVQSPNEVAIVGENWAELRRQLDQEYLPNTLLLGGKDEGSLELLQYKLLPGQTTIFVCRDKVCKLPVTEVKAALELVEREFIK